MMAAATDTTPLPAVQTNSTEYTSYYFYHDGPLYPPLFAIPRHFMFKFAEWTLDPNRAKNENARVSAAFFQAI